MYRLKRLEFRPQAVVAPLERAAVRVLGKWGSYVRRAARKRLKKSKRNGTSRPGDSPVAHSEALRLILYEVDRVQLSVIIGPIRLRGKVGLATRSMEEGGPMTFLGKRHGKPALINTTVEARPFMRPAFESLLPKLPEMWRNAISN